MQTVLREIRKTVDVVRPKELEVHQPGAWVIARSDNAAACYLARRHLSTKPIMAM